jgi:hypothetical protein
MHTYRLILSIVKSIEIFTIQVEEVLAPGYADCPVADRDIHHHTTAGVAAGHTHRLVVEAESTDHRHAVVMVAVHTVHRTMAVHIG